MIRFVDVSKIFAVKKQNIDALQHVSLQIDKGDIFGVIGFSGAGKSTLLRMVNALETPTSGHVEINGEDISGLPFSKLRKVRKNIGMIFQQFNLLNSRTVYENVAIPLILKREGKKEYEGKKEIHDRVSELLEFVELSDKSNVYPERLSGGQKQRVGIARALATNPSILLCDEATSALDPETTDSILRLLERINRDLDITILIVTHEIQVIQRICNKVAVMDHGRIVESGNILDVFSDPHQGMTRRFVGTVIPDRIPESTIEELRKDTRNFKIYKIRFLSRDTDENVLYCINREFRTETRVLFASVNELQHTVLKICIIQVIGDDSEIEKTAAYLYAQHLNCEEVIL